MHSSTKISLFSANPSSSQRMSTQPAHLDPSSLIPAQHQRKSGFKLSLFSGSALHQSKNNNDVDMYEYSDSNCSSSVQDGCRHSSSGGDGAGGATNHSSSQNSAFRVPQCPVIEQDSSDSEESDNNDQEEVVIEQAEGDDFEFNPKMFYWLFNPDLKFSERGPSFKVEEDINSDDFMAMRRVNREILTQFFAVTKSQRRSTKKHSRVIPEFSIALEGSPLKQFGALSLEPAENYSASPCKVAAAEGIVLDSQDRPLSILESHRLLIHPMELPQPSESDDLFDSPSSDHNSSMISLVSLDQNKFFWYPNPHIEHPRGSLLVSPTPKRFEAPTIEATEDKRMSVKNFDQGLLLQKCPQQGPAPRLSKALRRHTLIGTTMPSVAEDAMDCQ
ncbi:hypothetical protein FGO68_gene5685 [Halteria grandinella]|uniref:Uncharacterized protein n=1 Tax=Halteria grandinella TaxID=5974 RepID=A0A8J8T2J5_HALGN|nr:hypothetical protein FGO68_gene5685 [Halteria grandinella]